MSKTIDLIKAGRLLVLKDIHARHKATLARIEAKANDISQGIKVYRVIVANKDWGLYTPEAYHELQLGFSTGAWHTHRKEVEYVEDYSDVTTLSDLNDEADAL